MTELRRHRLDIQVIGTRKAPLTATGSKDWMNTGDAWVAKSKKEDVERKAGASALPAGNPLLLVEELFLTAGGGEEGPNRVYCASARPEDASGPLPVLLVFHGGGGHASGALALATARRHPGMAAVAMDYNGQFRPGPKGRFTEWKTVTAEIARAAIRSRARFGQLAHVAQRHGGPADD